jgi:hypothetical protein
MEPVGLVEVVVLMERVMLWMPWAVVVWMVE